MTTIRLRSQGLVMPGEDLSSAKVIDAAGGDPLTFMVAELNRAADA